MKYLKDSIRLLRPYIIILLLLVVGIIIGIVSLQNIRKKMDILYNETYIVNNAAYSMNAAFEEIQKSIFLAAVMDSQDVIDQEIANVKTNANILQEQLPLIKQNFSESSDIVARLENNLAKLAPMQDHVLNLIVQNDIVEVTEYMEDYNIPVITEAQKELGLLIRTTDTMGNDLFSSIQATQRNVILLLVSFAIISVLFGMRAIRSNKQAQK